MGGASLSRSDSALKLEKELNNGRTLQLIGQLDTSSTEFRSHHRDTVCVACRWKFKKCSGGQEFILRSRMTLEKPFGPSLRTEVRSFFSEIAHPRSRNDEVASCVAVTLKEES